MCIIISREATAKIKQGDMVKKPTEEIKWKQKKSNNNNKKLGRKDQGAQNRQDQ